MVDTRKRLVAVSVTDHPDNGEYYRVGFRHGSKMVTAVLWSTAYGIHGVYPTIDVFIDEALHATFPLHNVIGVYYADEVPS